MSPQIEHNFFIRVYVSALKTLGLINMSPYAWNKPTECGPPKTLLLDEILSKKQLKLSEMLFNKRLSVYI